jgi:hypothetical protein
MSFCNPADVLGSLLLSLVAVVASGAETGVNDKGPAQITA